MNMQSMAINNSELASSFSLSHNTGSFASQECFVNFERALSRLLAADMTQTFVQELFENLRIYALKTEPNIGIELFSEIYDSTVQHEFHIKCIKKAISTLVGVVAMNLLVFSISEHEAAHFPINQLAALTTDLSEIIHASLDAKSIQEQIVLYNALLTPLFQAYQDTIALDNSNIVCAMSPAKFTQWRGYRLKVKRG